MNTLDDGYGGTLARKCEEQMAREGKPLPAARGSARCVDCKHGKEHYTHLTGCVACCYPRERAPQIVDRSVLRMGRWCVPNATAAICPHYAPNS